MGKNLNKVIRFLFSIHIRGFCLSKNLTQTRIYMCIKLRLITYHRRCNGSMSRRPCCRFFLENNSEMWYFVDENFTKFFSSHNIDKEIRGMINSRQYESHIVENTTSVGSGLEAVIHVHYSPWRLSDQNQDTFNEMNRSVI